MYGRSSEVYISNPHLRTSVWYSSIWIGLFKRPTLNHRLHDRLEGGTLRVDQPEPGRDGGGAERAGGGPAQRRVLPPQLSLPRLQRVQDLFHNLGRPPTGRSAQTAIAKDPALKPLGNSQIFEHNTYSNKPVHQILLFLHKVGYCDSLGLALVREEPFRDFWKGLGSSKPKAQEHLKRNTSEIPIWERQIWSCDIRRDEMKMFAGQDHDSGVVSMVKPWSGTG